MARSSRVRSRVWPINSLAISRSFRFHPSGEEPQRIGEPVEIDDDFWIPKLLGFLQRANLTLSAAADSARKIQCGRIDGCSRYGPVFGGDALSFDLFHQFVQLGRKLR